MVSAEDDLHRTVVPRLLAANADLQRVFTAAEDALITLPESVAGLEALIVAHKVQFLVIDPLNAYLSDKLNAYKDTDIRQALTPLKHMAERQRVAVMIVHHINRSVSTQASQHVSGSSGIRNAARALFFVGADPNDETKRVFACDKMNVGPKPPSLSFSIETKNVQHGGEWFNDLPRLNWNGVTTHTADDLVTSPQTRTEGEGGARLEEAKTFYRKALASGERRSADVETERDEAGIRERTAKSARSQLGVESFRRGHAWYMKLPESEEEAENGDD